MSVPRDLWIVCVALLVGVLALALVLTGNSDGRARTLTTGPLAYRRVDELMTRPADHVDEELKLHGYVQLGSMETRVAHDQRALTFVLHERKVEVRVRLDGPAPETLQDRAEVIATGRLVHAPEGTYVFEATEVIAKCPDTYNTANGPVPAATFR